MTEDKVKKYPCPNGCGKKFYTKNGAKVHANSGACSLDK